MATTYLAPGASPAPIYDDALVDVFQINVVGITGIPGNLVRPRWQPEPPNQPDFNVNWAALGVTVADGDRFAYKAHDPAGNGGLGADYLEKDERIDVMLSFYGPNALGNAKRYEDGLQIDRNRDDLLAYGIKLKEVLASRNIPALLKNKWVTRVDVPVIFMRRIRRVYGVPTVVGIPNGSLNNEQYVTQLVVTPPAP